MTTASDNRNLVPVLAPPSPNAGETHVWLGLCRAEAVRRIETDNNSTTAPAELPGNATDVGTRQPIVRWPMPTQEARTKRPVRAPRTQGRPSCEPQWDLIRARRALVQDQPDHAGSAEARTVGGLGDSIPQCDHHTMAARAFREHASPNRVEVPGIEPGSSVALPGLLRAQFTLSLLDPTDLVN